jgi:cytochrome bd-type quinol oxidase subunit 2
MNLSAFFGVVSTVDFALLGLWWVTVQTRPDLRKRGSDASRMAYMVSLQFIVPGTAALLAQVDPALTAIWRISFAIAGLTGILAILLLVPTLTASGALMVARFLRLGTLPLYAVMTFIAVAPGLLSNTSARLSALQVEAILFCLVIFLGAQVAWAAAMSPDPATETHAPDPVTETRP